MVRKGLEAIADRLTQQKQGQHLYVQATETLSAARIRGEERQACKICRIMYEYCPGAVKRNILHEDPPLALRSSLSVISVSEHSFTRCLIKNVADASGQAVGHFRALQVEKYIPGFARLRLFR